MRDLSNLQGNEKYTYIQNNFNDIAHQYNLFNDISTFFLHRIWKKTIIQMIEKTKKSELKALDLCCGTGDIAVRLCESKAISEVKALDFSKNMIDIAKIRLLKYEHGNCELGDAMNLSSIENESYDVVTMAFGLRNVTNIEQSLQEIWRVLKKGGTFICLDIGKVKIKALKYLVDFYFFKLVPVIGNILWKNEQDMFKYLPMSSINYPNQEKIIKIFEKNGFSRIILKEFVFGNVVLHKCEKQISQN